jgi:hypothetical protein
MTPWLHAQVGGCGGHALLGHDGRLARLAGLKLLKQLFRCAHRPAHPARSAGRLAHSELRLHTAAPDLGSSCALAGYGRMETALCGVRVAIRRKSITCEVMDTVCWCYLRAQRLGAVVACSGRADMRLSGPQTSRERLCGFRRATSQRVVSTRPCRVWKPGFRDLWGSPQIFGGSRKWW